MSTRFLPAVPDFVVTIKGNLTIFFEDVDAGIRLCLCLSLADRSRE